IEARQQRKQNRQSLSEAPLAVPEDRKVMREIWNARVRRPVGAECLPGTALCFDGIAGVHRDEKEVMQCHPHDLHQGVPFGGAISFDLAPPSLREVTTPAG